MNTLYSAQAAIRPDDPAGSVHVQVTGKSEDFFNGYQRTYGAAFEIKDSALFEAVKARTPRLKSKAGTHRLYVPVSLEVYGEGLRLTLPSETKAPEADPCAPAPKTVAKIFSAAHVAKPVAKFIGSTTLIVGASSIR